MYRFGKTIVAAANLAEQKQATRSAGLPRKLLGVTPKFLGLTPRKSWGNPEEISGLPRGNPGLSGDSKLRKFTPDCRLEMMANEFKSFALPDLQKSRYRNKALHSDSKFDCGWDERNDVLSFLAAEKCGSKK